MSDSHAAPPAYVHFSFSSREMPSGEARQVGELLVRECLQQIDKNERGFAPKLWVLWATSAWAPFKELLEGIRSVTRQRGDAPLVGASAAACMFNKQVYPEGVVLWCLACAARQPNITAHLAMAPNARENPKAAADGLLKQLGLTETLKNPRGNRMLLAFIPGFSDGGSFDSYNAMEIHRELRQQTAAVVPIFGGVSALLAGGRQGAQFYYDTVLHDSLVAALIETDLRFALGMAHGLTPTDKVWHVEKPGGTTREVTLFAEGTPKELLQREPKPHLFGLNCLEHQEVIAYEPSLSSESGTLKLLKPIPPKAALTLLRPNPKGMAEAALQAAEWAMQRVGMTQERIIAGIGIACTARFVWSTEIGYSATRAMQLVSDRFPLAAVVGCYMDGETSLDHTGSSVIGNWSVAMMAVSDELSPRAQLYRGFMAFSERGRSAAAPQSIEPALDSILDLVEGAGFPGGMVSLVFKDSNKEWIVPCQTRGRWNDAASRLTLERNADSLTASVVGIDAPGYFVADSPDSPRISDQEKQAFRDAGVISQYIARLGEGEALLGVLYVDLGDMRTAQHETPEQRLVLEGIARYAKTAIADLFHIMELRFAQQIDTEYDRSLSMEPIGGSVDAAIDCALQPVLDAARQALDAQGNVDIIYARVADEARRKLRLSAGYGAYWEAARGSARYTIDVETHQSPSTQAFNEGGEWLNVVNDATADPHVERLCRDNAGTDIEKALRLYRCYANTAFLAPDKRSMGILTVGSTKRNWLLHAGHLACLHLLAERVGMLVHYVRDREELRRVSETLKYSRNITPLMGDQGELHSVLRNYLQNVGRQYGAVVSCYLWDGERDRLVLRGQANWSDSGWLEAANYGVSEGLTGTLANDPDASPEVVTDISAKRKKMGLPGKAGKYAAEMFGPAFDPEQDTAEAVLLPLMLKPAHRPLGIVSLHRVRKHNEKGAFYAEPDALALAGPAGNLAAILRALMAFEDERWQRQEEKRLSQVEAAMAGEQQESYMLQKACTAIRRAYGAIDCAVFLLTSGNELRMAARDALKPVALDPHRGSPDAVSATCWEADQPVKLVYGEERVPPPDPHSHEPEDWRRWNLVSAVCLPLGDSDPLGVLYVKWDRLIPYRRKEDSPVHHDARSLKELGSKVFAKIAHLRQLADRRRRRATERALHELSAGAAAAWAAIPHSIQDIVDGVGKLVGGTPPTSIDEALALVGKLSVCHTRLATLLDTAASVEHKFLRPDIVPCPVSGLVKSVMERLSRSRVEAPEQFIEITETSRAVMADEFLMTFALYNIVLNAILHHPGFLQPDGGLGSPRVRIEAVADESLHFVHLRVTDNGEGFKEDPFEAALRGRGFHCLGIPLSWLAMKAQKGDLIYSKRPDNQQGTVATLKIPLKKG